MSRLPFAPDSSKIEVDRDKSADEAVRRAHQMFPGLTGSALRLWLARDRGAERMMRRFTSTPRRATGRVEFTLRPGGRFDEKAFREAIEALGFRVGKVTVETDPVATRAASVPAGSKPEPETSRGTAGSPRDPSNG